MTNPIDARNPGCFGRRMKRTQRPRRRDSGRARGAPIIDAVLLQALEELATAGLEGFSVERLARRAAVNKTSIYRRWPTREALVAAALERIAEGVSGAAPDTGSLRTDLLGLLGPVAQFLEQPVGRAVLRAAMSEAAATNVAALAARKLEQRARGRVSALVRRAKARNEWRAGVGGELVLGALVGAAIHRAMLEHQPLTPRWLAGLVEVTLEGLTPRPRRAAARAPAPRRARR
jgi:AcrR family transcriptional regulator